MKRQLIDRERPGQVVVLFALALVVLCGMATLGVDVAMAWSTQHRLQNSAASAAVDARQLLANRANVNSLTLDDQTMWRSIDYSLTKAGLTIGNPDGRNAPADPCHPGPNLPPYASSEVGVTAIYLNDQNQPINDPNTGSPFTITRDSTSSVPGNASGVQVTLVGCQRAAFGGVIGHGLYAIKVNPSAGQPLIANTATNTSTDAPTSTDVPTSTPTPTSTGTATITATPTPVPCNFPIPVAVTQNTGFFITFTTTAPGDITAFWTVQTQSASFNLYIGLYSGQPLGTGTGTPGTGSSTRDPSTNPISGQMELKTLPVVNGSNTETLDYTADGHPLAPAGTYTVYFYNANNHDDVDTNVGVTFYSTSCSGIPSTPTVTGTRPPTSTATSTLTALPTSTGTVPPTSTPVPVLAPYSVSAAPDDSNNGPQCGSPPFPIQPEIEPGSAPGDANYQAEEYYCPGVYSLSAHSKVVLYANGNGLGNDYSHDSDFKGYIGNSSLYGDLSANPYPSDGFKALFLDEVDIPEPSGEGDNPPTSCVVGSKWQVPLISRIAHHGASDWFAPMALIEVTITSCGDPTEGTISGVIYDPLGIVGP